MSKWWNDTTDVLRLKNHHEPIVIKQLVASHFSVNRKIQWPQKQRMPEGLPHLLALSIDGSAETINLTHQVDWTVGNTNHPPGFSRQQILKQQKNWGRVPRNIMGSMYEKGPLSPTNLWTNSKVWRLWRFGFGVWFHGFFSFRFVYDYLFLKGAPIWFEIEKVQKRKKNNPSSPERSKVRECVEKKSASGWILSTHLLRRFPKIAQNSHFKRTLRFTAMVLRVCRLFDLQDCETTSSSYGHLTNMSWIKSLGRVVKSVIPVLVFNAPDTGYLKTQIHSFFQIAVQEGYTPPKTNTEIPRWIFVRWKSCSERSGFFEAVKVKMNPWKSSADH